MISLLGSVVDGSIVLAPEPLHGVLLGDSMLGPDGGLASPSQAHPASWPLQHHVEVHAEDAGEWVILDAQIDVLLNTEAEAPSIREVLLLELSVLDLEAALQDLVGLVTPDCNMHGDLLVPLDVEAPDGVSCPGWDWLLAREILKHLSSLSELIP